MANFDKVILNGTTYTIPSGGGGGTVDTQLSPTSTNAVQNKAIYGATNLYTYYSDESNYPCDFTLTQTENNEEYRINIDISNTTLGGTYFYVYIPLNGSTSYQDSSQDYMYIRFEWSDLSDLGYWDTTNDDIYASHTEITLSQSNGHVFVNIKPTAFDGHSNFLYGQGYLHNDNTRYTKENDMSQTGFMCLNTAVCYKYNTPVILPLTYYADEVKKATVDEVTTLSIDSNYYLNLQINEKNLLTKESKRGKTITGFKLDNECFQYTSAGILSTKYIFKSLSNQPSDTITQFESGVQLTNSFTTSTTGIKFCFKPEIYGSFYFEIKDYNDNNNYLNISVYHYNNYTETSATLNGNNKSYTISGDLEDFTLFTDEISDAVTFTSPYISYAQGELKDYNGIEKIEIYNNCTIESIQDKVNRLEADKQDVIDSSHKLDADLVDDTTSTNKFVTASDKSTWSGKQDELVSGTNIKTINNESILGSGNITIQGGGSSYTAGEGIDITNDVISVDIDDEKKVIASALTELHNDKADKNQLNNYQLKGDYQTGAQVDAKIATATSGFRSEAEAINVEKVDAAALTDLNARVTALETALGNISSSLDTINGEVI